MSAGTIALTANGTAVTGTGTTFTTELKAGDFVVATVGGTAYTLGVLSVTSNTALVLSQAYQGATASGLTWQAVPFATLNLITSALAAQVSYAVKGFNLDKNNWQQIFSGTGNVTVNLPDGTSWTGPAWNSFTSALNNKADKTALGDYAKKGANSDITSIAGLTTALSLAQGGTGSKNASDARTALGLGSSAIKNALSASGNVLSEGDGGLLGSSATIVTNPYLRPTSQFTRSGGGSGNVPYGAGFYSSYDTNIAFHLNIEGSGLLRYRQLQNGLISYDYVVYSTGNTTKASNGVLSAASPVCRIVKDQSESGRADMDESSFEWCGCGTANDEARGISITRLDVGVYKIAGADGFAKEGWYLMPPRDPAGSGDLGIVEGEETEGNGITIRLYKRRYVLSDDGEIELTKGAPIDVPSNSWIDVRLQMPEDSAWNTRIKENQQEDQINEE